MRHVPVDRDDNTMYYKCQSGNDDWIMKSGTVSTQMSTVPHLMHLWGLKYPTRFQTPLVFLTILRLTKD
jgi:hypothetical protein